MAQRPTSEASATDQMTLWNMDELNKAIVWAAEGQVQVLATTPRSPTTDIYSEMYESSSMISHPSSSSASSYSCPLQSPSTSAPVTMAKNHNWLYSPLYQISSPDVEPSYVAFRRERTLRKMKTNVIKMKAKKKTNKAKNEVKQKYRLVIRLDDDVPTSTEETEGLGLVETMDVAGDEAKKLTAELGGINGSRSSI